MNTKQNGVNAVVQMAEEGLAGEELFYVIGDGALHS